MKERAPAIHFPPLHHHHFPWLPRLFLLLLRLHLFRLYGPIDNLVARSAIGAIIFSATPGRQCELGLVLMKPLKYLVNWNASSRLRFEMKVLLSSRKIAAVSFQRITILFTQLYRVFVFGTPPWDFERE